MSLIRMRTTSDIQELKEAIRLANVALREAENITQEHLAHDNASKPHSCHQKKIVMLPVNHLRELVEAAQDELERSLRDEYARKVRKRIIS